ncbi:MAG: hypothetical protein NVSMB9_12310 [Isosphaeraceae bacterium]
MDVGGMGKVWRVGRPGSVATNGRIAPLVVSAVLMLTQAGCRGMGGEATDRMVPRGWKGNPWGPVANTARARGEMAVVPYNPSMMAWEEWGRRTLKDGDILFRMGNARAALGLFPFSRISAAIAGSRFSHTGIIAFEDGKPYVYDTSTGGPQRQPLAIWVLDTRGSIAVKRPRAQYQSLVPQAVAFCRSAYRTQIPFDYNMKLGDDRLYCIELTERAYRSAGLPLSRAIRLDQLPRYGEFPNVVRLLRLFTSMVPQQLAYVIGNEAIGIWSSPALELIYEAPDARSPLPGNVAPAASPQSPPLSRDELRPIEHVRSATGNQPTAGRPIRVL